MVNQTFYIGRTIGFEVSVKELWFEIFLLGMVLMVPIHYASIKHEALKKRFGEKKGERIGEVLGMISGWGFFGFWFGIWLAPQPLFYLNIGPLIVMIRIFEYQIILHHLLIGLVFIIPGAYLGIAGVRTMGIKAAETHHPEEVISTGIYSRVRHPQYLGGILSHVGIVFLLQAGSAFNATIIIIILNALLCWLEERELLREFGDEYKEYKEEVPMLIPRLRT
ncbi:MAG: conserved membrane protein of unknown function [Candidatus Thorarchaeota archaeon]|nr:MAG: conserved membrane protein of unknown function [Candidatus Thorarchaeota archaeon]